jgi:hypothetical protein
MIGTGQCTWCTQCWAHRAEHGLGEAAVAAVADDEQVSVGCGVQQDLRQLAVDDLAPPGLT